MTWLMSRLLFSSAPGAARFNVSRTRRSAPPPASTARARSSTSDRLLTLNGCIMKRRSSGSARRLRARSMPFRTLAQTHLALSATYATGAAVNAMTEPARRRRADERARSSSARNDLPEPDGPDQGRANRRAPRRAQANAAAARSSGHQQIAAGNASAAPSPRATGRPAPQRRAPLRSRSRRSCRAHRRASPPTCRRYRGR